MSAVSLLEEMDHQQNELLQQLDELNERVLSLIAEWQGESREREAQVEAVLANVSQTAG